MSLIRRLAVLLALFVVLAPGVASAYTPPPVHAAVNDTASALTPAQRATLESRLATYRTRTTNEIVVFVLASLAGERRHHQGSLAVEHDHCGDRDG